MRDALINFEPVLLSPDDTIQTAFERMTVHDIGIILVVDEARHLLGVVVDGDIRRSLLKTPTLDQTLSTVMTHHPRVAPFNASKDVLMALAEQASSPWLPLLDQDGVVKGLLNANTYRLQSKQLPNAAVIMAGGRGERLRPFTEQTPKPMMTIGERPLLETLISFLRGYGFVRFYLSVNYLAEQIEAHFGDGHALGLDIRYLREDRPLGTAGSLRPLAELEEHPVLIVNGDVLSRVNPHALLEFHRQEGVSATLAVREHRIKIPYGVVETAGNRVTQLREKPSHTVHINAGIYVIDPAIFACISLDEKMDMPDVLTRLNANERNSIACFPVPEYWVDIGSLEDLEKARSEFEDNF